MKEVKHYICDVCGTEYNDKKRCEDCEKSHKLLDKAIIIGDYKSISMIPGGEPYKIRVKFPGANKFIEYKR